MLIGNNFFWLKRIREKILLNYKTRTFFENLFILKPIIRSQAEQVFDLVSGFVYSQILYACVSLELFEKLRDGPLTLVEISKSCDIEITEMEILVEGAIAIGLLEKRERNTIGLGVKGMIILTKPAISALVKHHKTLYQDLTDPVSILKRKKSDTVLSEFWPYAESHGKKNSYFSEGVAKKYSNIMAISQPLISDQICSTYAFKKHKKILDLGGGQATFTIKLAKLFPGIKMTVFDLPQVSKIATQKIRESGFQNQIDVKAGSFLSDQIPIGYDLITLIRVLYDHSDDNVLKILTSVKKAMPEYGTLLIAEPMAGGNSTKKMSDAYFGMYLMAMGKGSARTHKEIFAFLKQVGFKNMRTLNVSLPIQTGLIVAKS